MEQWKAGMGDDEMWKTSRSLILAGTFTMVGVIWLLADEPTPRSNTLQQASSGVHTRPASHGTGQAGRPGASSTYEAVIISESNESMLAVVAPVVARMADGRRRILLAVTSYETHDGVRRLTEQVGTGRTLVIRAKSDHSASDRSIAQTKAELTIPDDSLTAGVALACRFWGRSRDVVLADPLDGEACLLGATLATHRGVPFLPVPRTCTAANLAGLLRQIEAKGATLVVCGGASVPPWTRDLPQEVSVLRRVDAQAAIVSALGPQNIRNVIVVRAPEGSTPIARACWLAPYLSHARKSAVVVVASDDAKTVEREVAALVSRHRLQPRTVTVLADHIAIGVHTAPAVPEGEGYSVDTEPCSGAEAGGAAAYGVGRIPFADAARASLLIGRALARERHNAGPTGGVLMVANPRPDHGPLPLAETVARLNVEEFRNWRVPVTAYFGVPSEKPEIRKAAGTAGLIIYQGHITDQGIFRSPPVERPEGLGDDIATVEQDSKLPLMTRAWYSIVDHGLLALDHVLIISEFVVFDLPEAAEGWLSAEGSRTADHGRDRLDDDSTPYPWLGNPVPSSGNGPSIWELGGRGVGGLPTAAPPPLELAGNALVVIQSCSSLQNEATSLAIESGSCGVVGSVTSIHSASGSSFVKAWSDAVVYRRATAGEAMRDARNYLLLVSKLKEARGHTERSKVLRVALSFRLWGDPEAIVLPEIKGKPTRLPVTGRIQGRDVKLQIPRRKLPEVKTAKYVARSFPNSQVAGIVKRLKDKSYRRLMPLYYLRLDRPADLDMANWRRLIRDSQADTRAVFSTDPLGRYVYVVYFPDEEKSRESITLEFRP